MLTVLCRPLRALFWLKSVQQRLADIPRLVVHSLPNLRILSNVMPEPIMDPVMEITTFKRKPHKMRKHKNEQRKRKMRKLLIRLKKYEKRHG